MTGSPATGAALPGSDPSMDDILASIRRILNEDAVHANLDPAAAPHDDALILDGSMLAPGFPPVPAPMPAPVPATVPATVSSQVPVPPSAAPLAGSSLVAPAAAAAASNSVSELVRTLAESRQSATHRQGPTIEDLVREEIRPVLKAWLDTHLPPLVERLVRTEIERVVGRVHG